MREAILAIFIMLGMSTVAACGRDGRNGLDGANGSKGDQGEPGLQGATGPQGAEGQPGIAGQDGSNGQDATPVSIVKLCPGVTVYPSVFVEIAFCVGGKLYGTYSANGGFSTELPPGNYSSNAIGSSCSFTIGSNCQVSN